MLELDDANGVRDDETVDDETDEAAAGESASEAVESETGAGETSDKPEKRHPLSRARIAVLTRDAVLQGRGPGGSDLRLARGRVLRGSPAALMQALSAHEARPGTQDELDRAEPFVTHLRKLPDGDGE